DETYGNESTPIHIHFEAQEPLIPKTNAEIEKNNHREIMISKLKGFTSQYINLNHDPEFWEELQYFLNTTNDAEKAKKISTSSLQNIEYIGIYWPENVPFGLGESHVGFGIRKKDRGEKGIQNIEYFETNILPNGKMDMDKKVDMPFSNYDEME